MEGGELQLASENSRQRRYVAVFYADLCDSTRLAAQLEAELYAEVLAELRRLCREIIPRHQGTLLQVHGDGQLSMFGFPQATEEDVRLAVDAALELHRAVRLLQFATPELRDIRLRLHSGVHAGVVLVQEGDVWGGSYQLSGEVTNLCQRLSAAAGEDELLVCAESLQGSEGFFDCGPERDLRLKGIQQPVRAFPVRGANREADRYTARRTRSRLDFVGRENELALLQQRWAAVCSGVCVTVYLVGSPGVGKSRLVEHFLNTPAFAEVTMLRGHCEAEHNARPLGPFHNMLRARPDLVASEEGLSEEALSSRLLARFVELSEVGPLVLFIDDWQWADEASRRLIAQLVPRIELPIMILLARRDMEEQESSMLSAAEIIPLDGLHDPEVDEAIQTLLPGVDPFVRGKICALAGGNPLFLEELCQASSVDRLDHAPSPVAHAPQWLYSLVQARVLQLDPMERQIVQVAAVFGTSAPLWLLQKVAGFEGVEALTGLMVLDLLFPGDSGHWAFKHGLTREIVYDLVELGDKRRLHRIIARALLDAQGQEEKNPEALAYHFAGAGMRNEAVHYAELAGTRALAAPALALARSQFRLAIELLDSSDVSTGNYRHMLSLARRMNAAAILDPGDDELPLLKRILELATERRDLKGQANAQYWIGTVHYGMGRPREALLCYQKARMLAQECGHTNLVVETGRTLGQAKATNCEHLEAIVLLQRAIGDTAKLERGSREAIAVAYTLGCLGMILGDQGDFDGAYLQFQKARDLLVGDGDDPIEINFISKLSAVQIWAEDWDSAIATAERVRRLSERVTNVYLFGMGRVLEAYARWRQDGAADALEIMAETTGWLEKSGQRQFLSLNYAWLAEAHAGLGLDADVRGYVAKAFMRARSGDGFGLALAARSAAVVAGRAQWNRSGDFYLGVARRSAEARGSLREAALNDECAAKLAAAAGEKDLALEYRASASVAFERLGIRRNGVALD